MNTQLSDDLAAENTRKQASIWLARVDRGLRGDEVPALRAWLAPSENRDCIVTTARIWHGPEIVAVLSALFPIQPEPAKRRPRRELRDVLACSVVSLAIVVTVTLMINGNFDAPPIRYLHHDRMMPSGARLAEQTTDQSPPSLPA